jgi:hypothetical protein
VDVPIVVAPQAAIPEGATVTVRAAAEGTVSITTS